MKLKAEIIVSGSDLRVELPLQITFNPKEDITAFELAQCMQIFVAMAFGQTFTADEFNPDESIKRHFEIVNPNKPKPVKE